jgi:hypothetical protein
MYAGLDRVRLNFEALTVNRDHGDLQRFLGMNGVIAGRLQSFCVPTFT